MMSRRTDLADSNGVAERMFTANKELSEQCLALEQLWEVKAANAAMAADHTLEMETMSKEMYISKTRTSNSVNSGKDIFSN
ncbi:hypothetical protein DYB37_014089 [Aphanomyces astaci]|uniref:Uncharacterized protein n=1 Tax=Aphanomyces astaci TaxID=112090 RepID=A0A3R7BNW3_APHAT|nr:hypothetical protein DYB37_014089 [Aphanomyces astaci]